MTELSEKLFLVENIRQIQGIEQVQNLVKSFAYRGDKHMELAQQFEKRFVNVHNEIKTMKIYYYDDKCEYSDDDFHNHTMVPMCSAKYQGSALLFMSKFCCFCGDYTEVVSVRIADFFKKIKHPFPKCKCK